ncbi:hypothetical protein [Microbacterium sp. RD06]|uniref:hypothetical protein n=1 Tax=Microbacterium sp. RD06 TaxID=3035796 RepID=UPI0011B2501D|nr:MULTISPECIES: hypothetical protein [Micrococcales]MCB8045321.1 hypothetical protein [Microbacterium oxydans]
MVVSLLVRRCAGGRRVLTGVLVTDATLLLIKLVSVEFIRDVQNQRDQSLVVRLRAQPRFG